MTSGSDSEKIPETGEGKITQQTPSGGKLHSDGGDPSLNDQSNKAEQLLTEALPSLLQMAAVEGMQEGQLLFQLKQLVKDKQISNLTKQMLAQELSKLSQKSLWLSNLVENPKMLDAWLESVNGVSNSTTEQDLAWIRSQTGETGYADSFFKGEELPPLESVTIADLQSLTKRMQQRYKN